MKTYINHLKEKTTWDLLHLAALYMLLSLFIFGSLYYQLLIKNLGFGLFFTISWFFCFLLTPLVLTENHLTLFWKKWAQSEDAPQTTPVKNKLASFISLPTFLFLIQFVLLLITLPIIPYSTTMISTLGIIAILSIVGLFFIEKTSTQHANTQLDFIINTLKLVLSIYVTWFLLYTGLLIIIINFVPYTERFFIQMGIILAVLIPLYFTQVLPDTRTKRLKWSFITGFFMIAAMIAYLSKTSFH